MNTYYTVHYFYMQNQLQIQFPNFDISIKVSVKGVIPNVGLAVQSNEPNRTTGSIFFYFFRTGILKMRDNGMSNECSS